MESSTTPTDQHPQKIEATVRQRSSCFGAIKQFGRSALRKVGRSRRDGHARTLFEPPPASVLPDEDIENAPPLLEREVLEVDSKEPSVFEFEFTAAAFTDPTQRERLTALCARYGLPRDAETFMASSTGAHRRVARSSRQRVRVICHQCDTAFRGEKACSNCGHAKCSDCRRQHLGVSPSPSSGTRTIPVDDEINEESRTPHPEAERVRDQDVEDGDEPRPVVQQSRYTCHKCLSDFPTLTNAICEHCGHEKCNRCSRRTWHIADTGYVAQDDAARSNRQKRVYRPPKQRVRHYCDHCSEMFPAKTNVCASCLHKRCSSCTRRPSKKRKLEADEEENTEPIQKVEQRLAEIQVPIASSSMAQVEARQ